MLCYSLPRLLLLVAVLTPKQLHKLCGHSLFATSRHGCAFAHVPNPGTTRSQIQAAIWWPDSANDWLLLAHSELVEFCKAVVSMERVWKDLHLPLAPYGEPY